MQTKCTLQSLNTLFNKIMTYNNLLLELSNNPLHEATPEEIFDFHITSHASSFIKNLYLTLDNSLQKTSVGLFLNARSILEGLSIKRYLEHHPLKEEGLILLKKQKDLIEYNQYKKLYASIDLSLPIELKNNYEETRKEYFRLLNVDYDDKEIQQIVRSPIPFLCNPSLNYNYLVKTYLGDHYAIVYQLCSHYIHPSINTYPIEEWTSHIINNTYDLIETEYKNLNHVTETYNLDQLKIVLFQSPSVKVFNECVLHLTRELDKLSHLFLYQYKDNYSSSTFSLLSSILKEMQSDKIYGLNEQVKCKWRLPIEYLASFYDIKVKSLNPSLILKLVESHHHNMLDLAFKNEVQIESSYETYKALYQDGVSKNKFKNTFLTPNGFTIDNDGKIKGIFSLIDSLLDELKEVGKEYALSDQAKKDYIESQMITHANGYLYFSSPSLWYSYNLIFIEASQVIGYILIRYGEVFEENYKATKDYSYKKLARDLTKSGKIIFENIPFLELSLKNLYKK